MSIVKDKNLELWKKVQTTNPKYTKKVAGRGGYTAIGATYQFKKATEVFGLYGCGWGVRGCKYDYVKKPNGEILEVILEATFYYKYSTVEGNFELSTCMPYQVRNDTRKKLLTDLTTKALSKLGFSADIFMGLFDDSEYIKKAKSHTQQKTLKDLKGEIDLLSNIKEVTSVWENLSIEQQSNTGIQALFTEKRAELKRGPHA